MTTPGLRAIKRSEAISVKLYRKMKEQWWKQTKLKTSTKLHNNRLDLLAYYERKRKITLTYVGITCLAHVQIFVYANIQYKTQSSEGGRIFHWVWLSTHCRTLACLDLIQYIPITHPITGATKITPENFQSTLRG